MDNIIDPPIDFRFATIQIASKRMEQNTNPVNNDVVFNFNIKVETRVQAANRLVMPFVTVVITEQDKPIELASFTIVCIFHVENFEETVKLNEQNLYIVPPDFDTMIRQISISTTRGVIYSELRGTYLHNAIVPVFFMDALKQEPENQKQAMNDEK
jgi:hypothetical protein